MPGSDLPAADFETERRLVILLGRRQRVRVFGFAEQVIRVVAVLAPSVDAAVPRDEVQAIAVEYLLDRNAVLVVLEARIDTLEVGIPKLRDDRVFVSQMRALVRPWHELHAEPQVVLDAILEFDHRAEAVVGIDDRRRLVLEVLDHVKRDRRPQTEPPLAFAYPSIKLLGAYADDRQLAPVRDLPREAVPWFVRVWELFRECRKCQLHARGTWLRRQRFVVGKISEHPDVRF